MWPYRARTKDKTEAGVKYTKHNGLADQDFDSFAALETHLAAWMVTADQRIHGTTYEAPLARFEQDLRIVHGTTVVATHRRSFEPFDRVIDPAHFAGLWRPAAASTDRTALAALGRDLADYAAVIEGGAL